MLLLRRRGPLQAAFGHAEHYMLHEEDTGNSVDHTFAYSRPLRALRVWLSLRVHGVDRFRTWIEATLAHAALLADEVRAHSSFELLHEPMLSTVCFRHVVPGMDDAGLDAHNERLARAMQADGRVYLAPAVVDGRTCLRACFVNFRTGPDAVRTVLEVAEEWVCPWPGTPAPWGRPSAHVECYPHTPTRSHVGMLHRVGFPESAACVASGTAAVSRDAGPRRVSPGVRDQ